MRWPVSLLAIVVAALGCGGDDGGLEEELVPIEDLPWPADPGPLPACTPALGEFEVPPLAAASGLVRIEPSSAMQPVGVEETIDLTVLLTTSPDRDATATGPMTVTLQPSGEVVSVSDADAGAATLVVRFDQPGVHTLTADFDADGRSGQIEIFAYESQLPVWSVTLDASDLDAMLADPAENIKRPASLVIEGETHEVEMRIHGGSSRFYPKKSFRFDLEDGVTAAGERHLILRSEYNDKSMLRNWLGLELFRAATWLPTSRTELVHLRVNGRYHGVMNHTQRVDTDFLLGNGLSPSASMYEADPPLALAVPGGNLTPLPASDYEMVYQWHNGGDAYVDLIELIEVVLQRGDSQLDETIADEIAIDNFLVYAAMMAALQNQDHIRKNYYLYRDVVAVEDRWFMLPWDLELSLGHLWTEENDVLEERIFTDGDVFVGVAVPERFSYFNQLHDRVLSIPRYRERFLLMLEHIASERLTVDFVAPRLDYQICLAMPDLVADEHKRGDNSEHLMRVDEIKDFVLERQSFIFDEVDRGLGF